MGPSNVEVALVAVAGVLAILLVWQLAWALVRVSPSAFRSAARWMANSSAWTRTHPLRAALQQRFPKSYFFVEARFDAKRFAGLPLTLLVAAALYAISLLGGLIDELLESKGAIAFDSAVNRAVDRYRTTALVPVFAWITNLGDSAALVGVALVATGFLWAHRRTPFVVPLWAAILGSQLTTWLGKFGFDRPRPDFVTAVTAISPAFPSGHATGAMAVYGFIAYAIARDLRFRRSRFEITFWTLMVVALIGFSRVFLSVHYATDVLAGFLVGGFWLLVAVTLTEFARERARR
jgi:undecaprenyl-diphosphatase